MKRRVGILISGRGSNMAALIEAARDLAYPAEIGLVLADGPDAQGLARAAAAGVPTAVVEAARFGGDRPAHEAAIDLALQAAAIDLVCLAGWIRLFTGFMVGRWAGRMLNIHPSLLPAFPGMHTHSRALAAGVKLHGCTVHVVTEPVDAGPILAQAAVPVLLDDDVPRLSARVLVQEHRLYPATLRNFAGDRMARAPAGDAALLNPLPDIAPAL